MWEIVQGVEDCLDSQKGETFVPSNFVLAALVSSCNSFKFASFGPSIWMQISLA